MIQFLDEPLRRGLDIFKELGDVEWLLEKAKRGIEFFDIEEMTRDHFQKIRTSRGSRRLAAFLMLLSDLASCKEFRLLSSAPVRCLDEDPSMERLNLVVEHVYTHYSEKIDMEAIYALSGMSQSTFSRSISRATGGGDIH